jgi:hypothetical protein
VPCESPATARERRYFSVASRATADAASVRQSFVPFRKTMLAKALPKAC